LVVWDCSFPGGCSVKRPDYLFKFAHFYIQIEVDESGHEQYSCVDEDIRLELIAADVGLPGFVIRINPDVSPCCWFHRKTRDGELIIEATSRFAPLMDKVEVAIRECLMSSTPEGISVTYLPPKDEWVITEDDTEHVVSSEPSSSSGLQR
jgi:hypothetical protein